MSKNQNRLLNTQRTSIAKKLLKGTGSAVLLSMLIFGALSVKEESSLAEATATEESSTTTTSTATNTNTSAATVSEAAEQQESFGSLEIESVTETESVVASQEAESTQRKAESKSEASTASVKGTASIASTASAVQFMGVQTSLNAQGTAGMVKWSTAMEQNSKYFEIERSLNGEEFESLGKIDARGQGVHNSRSDYSFEDKSLGMTQMPRVYYRIKQIGLDGKSAATDMVEYDLNLDLGLYAAILKPETDGKKIRIRYAGDQEGEMTLRIFKPSGEVLIEQKLQSDFTPQMVSVETAGWDTGAYFLQLANDKTSVMEQFTL